MKLAPVAAGLSGLLLLVSAPVGAQDTSRSTVPDSVQAMVAEFQQLQARLQQTQSRALEADTTLQSEQRALQEVVKDAMVAADPAMEAKMDSLPDLQQAAMAAQQAGDTARIRTIMATGQRLQTQVQEAQQRALQQEEVAAEVEAFQGQLLAAMEEIDPEVGSLVDRLEELSARLQAIRSGA